VGVTKGRSISAYPAVGPEVTIAGCKYLSIPMTDDHVDGNLVTAPAWPAHPVWLAKYLQVLERSVAEKAAGV
jgi:protease I